ncbi:S9 family peptidase [Candidatus Palauibacter sp.]|uniref:S9 family peptidase n=1 Tax=Candidatus Palauibacter sp. TaxID=3101350 RepID=UPI003B5C81E7
MYRAARFASASLLLVLFVGVAPLSAQNGDGPKTLSLDMYMDWERVSNPQISPDGRHVVYTKGWIDQINDRWESTLYIMNADGTRKRELIDGSGAIWSPDGTRIAFTAAGEPEGSQIFVRWMDAEGATTQITRLEQSPGNLRWSPDGTQIAFTMLVEDEESWPLDMPSRPDGAKWTEGPKIVTRMDYRQDRRGYVDQGHSHIFVVPADGGTPRPLTDGMWNHSNPQWSPDGSQIYFSSLREQDSEYNWRESEIYAVNVGAGSIRQLTSRYGPDGGAYPSPDGSLIAYSGQPWNDDTYRNSHIYVMNPDGTGMRQISGDFDRGMRGSPQLMWAPDGSGVYFNVSREGTRNLHFASLDGGVTQVTNGNHLLGLSSFNQNGMAVGTLSDAHGPGDVVSFGLGDGGDLRQLTRVNDDVLAGVTLGEVEEVWYKSADDWDIQGWIVKPPDFDPSKRYPLILSIHGGPHGMYNTGFNFGWQEHAANGYVVLYTNPRGSSGYGTDFGNAIKNAYPSKDFDDLMAGVDEVLDRGYIDEDNMFVYGCSGGGVLTSWVVGHTDRFRAASANCPVTNWLSFVGTTDGPGWYRNFENFPWDDPSEHLSRSPLMYVGNVTTPTMLMTGEMDLRTPMPQTEEYYQALKMERVPTAMIRFRNEWHGTSSTPSNFLRTQLFLRSWFERFGTHRDRPAVSEDAGS